MLSVGEWIVIEQALTEVRLNHESFPQCLRYGRSRHLIEGWDDMPLYDRIGVVAITLHGIDCSPPAKIVIQAYEKLCRGG